MQTVAIGSKNIAKVKAVKNAFESVFEGQKFDFIPLPVESNVNDQPIGDEETKRGALQRANNVFAAFRKEFGTSPDFSIGLEGGITSLETPTTECFAWMAILGGDGKKCGFSRTSSFVLPAKIVSLIRDDGLDLGTADSKVFGNASKKLGSVGTLTRGVIDRGDYYTQAMILALIPFLHPELY
eukprot:TRINITY_DN464_c0_g1_i1.p2 TRINITY_DN464_c0_g1~~TRINITY_DN464_c0_g1_i1.p2  ORF type:complete len:183 (-),score=44.22 TRINITY_DN464_c0_g1_i1:214-762(-)